MPDPKFLYGSHYSTPGYVLYYLVRVGKTVLKLDVKFLEINYQLCIYSFKDFFATPMHVDMQQKFKKGFSSLKYIRISTKKTF